MRLLTELLERPSTELLVNFMFEEINRFLSHKDQPGNFDALFGCSEWRRANELSGHSRRNFIHDLYRDQLQRSARARYVRSFEMLNERNNSDYFLFFATQNLRGLQKMKEAMWRIDPADGLRFSDATNFNQHVLFEPKPNRDLLSRQIKARFSGGRVRVGDVEQFVLEATAFHAGHYKAVLKSLEASLELKVLSAPATRRKGSFPDPDLEIEFL